MRSLIIFPLVFFQALRVLLCLLGRSLQSPPQAYRKGRVESPQRQRRDQVRKSPNKEIAFPLEFFPIEGADSPTTATPEAAANEVRESSAGETLDNGEDSSGGGTEGPTTRKLISTATIFDFDSARFNDGENEVVDIFGETDEEAASATTIEEDESSSMSSFVPIRDVARDEEFPGELDQTTENDGEAMTAAAAAATTVAAFITSRFSSSSPSSSATDVSDSNNSSSGNEGEEMTGGFERQIAIAFDILADMNLL